jgi:Mrp family chromosome partitioning ATPase
MDSNLQLFLRGLKPTGKSGNSVVIALTSSAPGEGVSYVTQSFAVELARKTRKPTIVTDTNALKNVDIFHYSQMGRHCFETDVPYLHVLQEEPEPAEFPEGTEAMTPLPLGSELDQGVGNLQTLRYVYDYVLVDCPSMSESGDAAFFASAVDGVVLVVEAEKTRKEQVRNALDTFEMADANVLGCVLNKRTYPIPNWVYRRV